MQQNRRVSGNGELSRNRIFLVYRAALATALFLCLTFLLPFLLQLPAGTPVKADAIVILGGGKGDRVAKALDLYRVGYAKNLVLTGRLSRPKKVSEVHDLRAEFLINRQVPADDISHLSPSENSWEEAQSSLRMMQQRGWERVIVVSDPPHMLRLSYVWGKAFRGSPMHFALVATEPAWWNPLMWWGNKTSSSFVLSEILKLGYYVIAY
jgi:Uncharacterized conserved protein